MIRLLFSLFLAVAVNICYGQNNAQKWVYLGFRIPEKVAGCVNDPSTKTEGFWMPLDDQYKGADAAKVAEMKAKYPGKFISTQRFFVKEGEQRFIGIIEKTWDCGGKNLSFFEGKDEADILAKAEKDKQLYREIKSYRLKELIDCAAEIGKQAKQRDGLPAPNKKVTETNYAGLMAKYTAVKTNSKAFTLAQLNNTKTNLIAVITFRLPNGQAQTESINPGSTLTTQIKAADFKVELTFKPYKPGDTSVSVLEWVKKLVKDEVTTQGDNVKSKYDPTCMCVRG